MQLTTEDKERIKQEARNYSAKTYGDSDPTTIKDYVVGAERATIYEREKQAEEIAEVEALKKEYTEAFITIGNNKTEWENKIGKLEVERTELKSQIKNADVRCQKLFDRTKDLEAECINLKSIADVLDTIVDTPEFGKMWPGTAHSLRKKLNSLKTKL